MPSERIQGLAQSVETTGVVQGLFQLSTSQVARLVLPSGQVVHVDVALIPGGLTWAQTHIGRPVQIRSIVRELDSGPVKR